MLSTVQRVLAKLVSPIWRTVDSDQEDMSIGAGSEEVRHLRSSVVTQICLDYGMIDDVIYFTGAQVLGGILLRVGDTVDGIAVRDGANGGWKALRVEKTLDTWEGNGADSESDSMRLRPLIGTVTSFSGDSGLINQTTFFPRYSLREGYEPMKGDWVQAQYFVNPTQWASQAHSVAPLRYQRLDEVRVSSVYGRSGVVDDTVFFTLESLLLPSSYKPSPGDMVNLVMVESNQSFYSWRALCMAPCKLRSAQPVFPWVTGWTVGRFERFKEGRGMLAPGVESMSSSSCALRLVSEELVCLWSPLRLTKRRLPNFLGSYPVPQAVRECVEAKRDVLVVQPCLGEVLAASNMRARFDMLLWLEELQAEGELKEFSITAAVLRKGVQYLHLDIPGLAEGRPSLFVGDRIALKEPQCNGVTTEYIALVNEIHEEEVSLRVNAELRQRYQGEPLDVEFTYNRITMRRCHHALEQARHFGRGSLACHMTCKVNQSEAASLVPLRGGGMPSKAVPTEGSFFNPLLNTSQREAVRRVLAGECRPTPYILFGPPGTGKTITLIEAVLQVYHFVPSSRVLVCTPSNSAADLVCVRLHHSGYLHVASLARINASCRQEESIPEVLRPYSKAGEDVRQAAFHRIVVTTCSSAGMLHHIGLQVGHFTHAFLDEAGQATEPEALIPLTLVSEKDGQIVLAGDPCQLGPVVKSNLATAFALGMSMLERLMANPLYCRAEWGYNPLMVTKLMYNYRSHEALLRLPSKLFYHGELCVRAPKSVVNSLCDWKRLPTKGFPLLFHGIRGTEMREGANPSWFNPGEAVQAMLYCCQLVKRLYNPISPADIGIIAPYRKQSEKIRTLMGRVGLSDIKVGSVEEFQGQEFLVIILSTVRSNESVLGEDLQNILGFLSNPKRFNVAITRPKALLIIIGNPHILVKDLCFRTLLQYCFDNGAFIGCDPPSSLRSSRRCSG
uniref:RNA helicase n=1 Tax=Gadus morhua TaxID=8049 RepID=A0A8C4Z8Q9_GADMO